MSDDREFDLGVTIRGFAPGQTIFSRYTLVRALGRGGMGVVWLARDGDLERDVALKFLPEMVAADPVAIDDLKHETRRSLELTHPHIVRVHDFIQSEGLGAISMEFVDGRTLAELRLERPIRAFQVGELKRWAQQICEALHYAHVQARVVHRDLKPANIMVDSRGRIKLTDFGISATVSDTVTRVSRLATTGGTAAYASPQQLMGETPSPSDDIYALGATLYELLTSRPPFHSGNLLLQVQNRVPPSMTDRRREFQIEGDPLPANWESVVAACLAKQPEGRPASVEEVALRLDIAGSFPAAPTDADADVGLTSRATMVSFGSTAQPATNLPPPTQPLRQTAPEEAPPPIPTRGGEQARAVAESVSPPPAPVEVEAKKPPEPARPPKKKSPLRWLVPVALLAAGGVALWYSDIPNKFRASQSVKAGQRAAVVSDWDGAVKAFRSALLLQPADNEIRGQLEEAQKQWLSALRRQVDGAESAQAVEVLEKSDAFAGESLIEPQASEFRKMLADAQARVRAEEAAKVRQQIESALRKADDGNVSAAVAELDSLAKEGVLVDEITSARKSAGSRAARANASRLTDALRSGQTDRIQSVLSAASDKPGIDAQSSAAAIMRAENPQDLMGAIKQAGVQLAKASFDTIPTDIAVIESTRDRLDDETSTKRYLADRYGQSAREFLDNGLPGFALYTLERQRAEGGAVDSSLEEEARQKLIWEFDLTFHLSATKQDGNRSPAVPTAPTRKVLHDSIDQRIGGWTKVVEMAPLGSSGAVEIGTRVAAVETRDNPTEERASVQYTTGVRNERNPEYERLSNELKDARRKAEDLNAQLARLEQGSSTRKNEAIVRGIVGVGLRISASQAREQVNELSKKLRQTPQTLRVPTYAEEPYRKISHHLTYATSLSATPSLDGEALATPVVWKAEMKHETLEVAGNATRGVPVQKPSYPEAGAIGERLAEGLAAQIRSDHDGLLRALMSASFKKLDRSLAAAAASPAAVADRRWGLATLWQDSGVAVPQAAELEEAVREELGLPGERHAAIASAEEPRSQAPSTDRETTDDAGFLRYTVRDGDTVRGIASRFHVSVVSLVAMNPRIANRRIRSGQVLDIPKASSEGK